MTDPQHRLLEIQDQDTIGDQLRYRREHHPLRAELVGLAAEQAAADSRRDAARSARDAIRGRQADLEAEAAATSERLAAIERRMYSGEVSAARDLQAMAAEVESLKSRIRALEDSVLEAMEEGEPVEAEVAALDEAIGALIARSAQAEEELSRAEAEIRSEEAVHAAARAEMVASVPADLLQRYERLRSHLGGVAVAPLTNAMCGGCHLSLPATELDRIRKAPPEAILTCDQCGRILVRP